MESRSKSGEFQTGPVGMSQAAMVIIEFAWRKGIMDAFRKMLEKTYFKRWTAIVSGFPSNVDVSSLGSCNEKCL